MSHTLLLTLRGPMQSWGFESHFPVRRTAAAPTKSGVLGMVASALGRERGASLEDLASLEFAVRIERPGELISDFQTAIQWERNEKAMPLSTRYYLSDAHFTAALGGDRATLEMIEAALRKPRWPLYLGRRSCPPMGRVSAGIHEGSPREVLSALKPALSPQAGRRNRRQKTLRLEILADAAAESMRFDVQRDLPIRYSLERKIHADRRFERFFVELPHPYHAPGSQADAKASETSPTTVLKMSEEETIDFFEAAESLESTTPTGESA